MTANDFVIRHLADLLTGRQMLSLSVPSDTGVVSSRGTTSTSSETAKALTNVTNLRTLLSLLSHFECSDDLRTIAIMHYKPYFARAPWAAMVAATDKSDSLLAHAAICAMGCQRPDYHIERGADGVSYLMPVYKDWRPQSIRIQEVKMIPVEWYVWYVRAVAECEISVEPVKLYIKDGRDELATAAAWTKVADAFIRHMAAQVKTVTNIAPVSSQVAIGSQITEGRSLAAATPITTSRRPSPAIDLGPRPSSCTEDDIASTAESQVEPGSEVAADDAPLKIEEEAAAVDDKSAWLRETGDTVVDDVEPAIATMSQEADNGGEVVDRDQQEQQEPQDSDSHAIEGPIGALTTDQEVVNLFRSRSPSLSPSPDRIRPMLDLMM